ncbi:MAG: hypothetical protein QF685_06775 [Verrucomicrobiota bacterium]|nr:hypothetical protein [Verrucomicrobiota bacterium]
MDDHTRYALSGAVYLAGLLVMWFMCVRLLLRVIDEHELAVMIEQEEPILRTKLLSAVELSGDSEGMDSNIFRRKAQQHVIEDLRGMDMGRLLPGKLVQAWVIAAAVVILTTGVMVAFDSGRTLLIRALVPMANIDRVSRNKIAILVPENGDASVPENDTLALRIKVTGPALKELPLLETKVVGDEESDDRRVFMDPTDGQEFTSSIAMARDEIQYRIHAGDAVSRWFTLRSVPRPLVISFEKKFTFPKYTGRAMVKLREETGDLIALSSTEVELKVHLDQPVATAALHLVTETQTNKLDFAQTAKPTQWALTLPITESGVFTIHVATAAGLDNKFRPEYSITAQPDLTPTIKLTEPKDEVTARPEDILPVTGEASDDVGLGKIVQLIKVNDKVWTTNTIQLSKPFGTNATFKLDWDLLKLDAKPGDLVMTKFAAADLKGSHAESNPLRLKVNSAIFEAKRIAAIEQQRSWTTNLIAATEKTIEFIDVLPGDIDSFILPGKDAERRNKTTEALMALEAAQTEWNKVLQQLPSIVRKAHAGRETAGLGLIGRVALRMDADWLSRARLHLLSMEGIVVDARVQVLAGHLPVVLKEVKSATDLSQATANGWLVADEAALSLDLLDYISRAATNMHRLAEADRNADPKVWERLGRRQGSVAKDLEVVLATLKLLGGRLQGEEGDIILEINTQLNSAHKVFVKNLKGAADKQLLSSGRELETTVNGAVTKLRPFVLDLAEAAAEVRIDLETSVGDTAETVERLQAAMEAREQAAKDYEKAKKSGAEILKADARRKVAGEMLSQHWSIAKAMLRGRARLEETGKAANAMFVRDAAQAALAIENLRAGVETGRDIREVIIKLDDISGAITKLEAAHELTVLETAIKTLAERERWEKKSTDANTLRPRDWQWLHQRLSITPELLRAVGLKGANDLEEATRSRAAKEVGAEMSERKRNPGVFLIEKSPKKK